MYFRQTIEKFREKKKLCVVFIDLEKAVDKVLRKVLKWALMSIKISQKYINLFQNMYERLEDLG